MGKWVLITGASGGIGQAIARKLSEQGYHIYLHYFKNKQSVTALKEQLRTDSVIVKADLSHKDGVRQLVEQLKHPIDILIHNSGDSYYGLITDMNDAQVERMVQLHITSPFNLTRHLLPEMVQQKKGSIILITSIWGITGASCEVLYSMVKGGQNTFVKSLAKEVGPSGIHVNGIAPGIIQTNMLAQFSEDDLSAIQTEIPLGRLGLPSDIANAVSFLTSEEASYISGEILSVNGAWYT